MERKSIKQHSVKTLLWQKLWTCRKTKLRNDDDDDDDDDSDDNDDDDDGIQGYN